MLYGYKIQIMINSIVQTKQEHLKQNHEETVYLGVYNTISVEVHGLSKDITDFSGSWFRASAITTTNKIQRDAL
jgi:hypothetical protein